MTVAPSLRTDLLTEAESLVNGDRNATYGEPHQDFQRTAEMFTAMGFRAPGGGALEAHHVALLLASVKLSRLVWSPDRRDSWTDLAGYAACGYEAYVLTRPAAVEEPSDGHHPRCDSPNLSHPRGCVPRSYQTGTEY